MSLSCRFMVCACWYLQIDLPAPGILPTRPNASDGFGQGAGLLECTISYNVDCLTNPAMPSLSLSGHPSMVLKMTAPPCNARPTPRYRPGRTGADQAATGTGQGHPARQRRGLWATIARVFDRATILLLSAAQDFQGRARHHPATGRSCSHFDSLVLAPNQPCQHLLVSRSRPGRLLTPLPARLRWQPGFGDLLRGIGIPELVNVLGVKKVHVPHLSARAESDCLSCLWSALNVSPPGQ